MNAQAKRTAKKQIDMLKGPMVPSFISYALPLALAAMLQQLYNAADIAVLGNLADNTAVASVGATTIVIGFLVNTFTAVANGANILAARVFGAKDDARIARLIRSTYTFSLILGLIITALGELLTVPLLRLTDCPETVFSGAEHYMRIYFIGAPASIFYNFMAGIMRSSGDSKRPFIYLATSGLVNVGLNIILVLTTGNPVASVAIATVASQYVSAALIFIHMFRANGPEKLHPFDFRMSTDVMLKILRFGIPSAISSVCFSIANLQIQSAVNAYGDVGISGNTAAISIENATMFSITNCASATVSTFVGQNLGAGNRDRALEVMKKSYIFWFLLGIAVSAIAIPLAKPLLGLIIPGDAQAIEHGYIRLCVILASASIHALMNTNNGFLLASGKTMIQMIVNLVGICGFRTLWMSVIYPLNKTPFMLYIAYPISFLLVLIVNSIFTYGIVKRLKKGDDFAI